jgi:hypothetical protein
MAEPTSFADWVARIELSLQGYTMEEISQQLPFSKRTVGRVRERLKKQLQRMHAE